MKISEKLRNVFLQLIPIYQKAIEELPDAWMYFLKNQYLEEGICWASSELLHEKIDDEMANMRLGLYWSKCPVDCDTKEEAIDCLQWRINKMKELLSHD